jgi:hypothetical protein
MVKSGPVRAVSVLVTVVLWSSLANAQGRIEDRLAKVKGVKCTFPVMATGGWTKGEPQIESKAAKMSVGFDEVNVDDGTARVIGAFGPSDIIVRLALGTLHFMQSFREGPLYVTTIFPEESRGGNLIAVHTRHEFTKVSLPGFTSRPEQYLGECAIE